MYTPDDISYMLDMVAALRAVSKTDVSLHRKMVCQTMMVHYHIVMYSIGAYV